MSQPPAGAEAPRLLDELEVRVEKLVTGGDGLARVGRFPLFISRAAPGDRLRVRVWQRKRDYGRAEILEVLEPGPDRQQPRCPYFGECGGCDLQHLAQGAQLEAKVAATRETLQRLGGIEWPPQVEVLSGSPWAYRQRARLRLEPGDEGARVGYLARGSHRLVAVDRCPVLAPELEALLGPIADSAGPEPASRIDVAAGDGGATTVSPPLEGLGRGAVSRRVGDLVYEFDARCFFQTHRELVQPLVERTVGEWRGETACDLYAGVGLFSLPLARRYRRVRAVEGDSVAVRYQRRNAARNDIGNLEVVAQAVESWVGDLPEGVDRVVVDPPRLGLAPPVGRALLHRRPRRLTYVSCDPGTLARDLARLCPAYRLEGLTLLDLFPQTGHIEAVAQLVVAE